MTHPIKIEKWVTSDGKEHPDQAAAVAHEEFLQFLAVAKAQGHQIRAGAYDTLTWLFKHFDVKLKPVYAYGGQREFRGQ